MALRAVLTARHTLTPAIKAEASVCHQRLISGVRACIWFLRIQREVPDQPSLRQEQLCRIHGTYRPFQVYRIIGDALKSSSVPFNKSRRSAVVAALTLALISGSAVASVAAAPMADAQKSVPTANSLEKIPHYAGKPGLFANRQGIGDTITAWFQVWQVDGVVDAFQWYRDGRKMRAIPGAHTRS